MLWSVLIMIVTGEVCVCDRDICLYQFLSLGAVSWCGWWFSQSAMISQAATQSTSHSLCNALPTLATARWLRRSDVTFQRCSFPGVFDFVTVVVTLWSSLVDHKLWLSPGVVQPVQREQCRPSGVQWLMRKSEASWWFCVFGISILCFLHCLTLLFQCQEGHPADNICCHLSLERITCGTSGRSWVGISNPGSPGKSFLTGVDSRTVECTWYLQAFVYETCLCGFILWCVAEQLNCQVIVDSFGVTDVNWCKSDMSNANYVDTCCQCVYGCIAWLFKWDFKELLSWYGDGAGNTVEENSSVFSLIQMR